MYRITIAPSQISDDLITLTPEQRHYLARVLRLQTGGQFHAIDGTGKLYLAEMSADDRVCIIEQLAIESREFSQPLMLVCALPKGNNFDDIVRACTELGVTNIFPALSDRTLLDPSPQKLQRWRKIAQEAAEQSERLLVPTIAEPRSLRAILTELPARSRRYFCEARGDRSPLLASLRADLIAGEDIPIIIAIGPEGGWTEAEIKLAIECNFQLVSIGRHILRTITAPIVALSIVIAALEN